MHKYIIFFVVYLNTGTAHGHTDFIAQRAISSSSDLVDIASDLLQKSKQSDGYKGLYPTEIVITNFVRID